MGKYIDSFKVFEAKYQTYTDYEQEKSKWGTPDELEQDALIKVKHMLPVSWDEENATIVNVTDKSDSKKGIEFEFKLASSDVISLFKVGSFRGSWDIYLNGKKVRNESIVRDILTKKTNELDQYLHSIKSYDDTYQYSDDPRSRKSGKEHSKKLKALYNKLSISDKKKAYKQYKLKFKTSTDFKSFMGA